MDIILKGKNTITLCTKNKYVEDDINISLDDSLLPSGTLEIKENGNYDVTQYELVNVNVASSGEPTEKITDLTGTTWLLNEELGIFSDRTMRLNFTTADGSEWTYFNMVGKYMSGGLTFTGDPTASIYFNSTGWVKEEYRTISITGGQHAKDELLILYLQAHAKQVK